MIPELLTVMPPVSVVTVPLPTPIALFDPLDSRFAVTVPEFVKVAPCVLAFWIWMTGPPCTPSELIVPVFVIEMIPLPVVVSEVPVPVVMPIPLVLVTVP